MCTQDGVRYVVCGCLYELLNTLESCEAHRTNDCEVKKVYVDAQVRMCDQCRRKCIEDFEAYERQRRQKKLAPPHTSMQPQIYTMNTSTQPQVHTMNTSTQPLVHTMNTSTQPQVQTMNTSMQPQVPMVRDLIRKKEEEARNRRFDSAV